MQDKEVYDELRLTEVVEIRREYYAARHQYQGDKGVVDAVAVNNAGKYFRITLYHYYPAKVSMVKTQAKPRVSRHEISKEEYEAALAKVKQEKRDAEDERLKPIRKKAYRAETSLPTKVRMERPACPLCERVLIVRKNNKTGQFFWACASFPVCKGTLQMSAKHEQLMLSLYPVRN